MTEEHAEHDAHFLTNFLVDLWGQRLEESLEDDLMHLSLIDIPDHPLLHEALFNMCKAKIC